MDLIKNFPSSYWDDPYSFWSTVKDFVTYDEIETVLNLLEMRADITGVPPWQIEILVDDFNLFPQEYVNKIFDLTKEKKALSDSGALYEVSKELRTVGVEVFERIINSCGQQRLKMFERAYEALKDDPTLTYDYWFSVYLKVGEDKDITDSIISAGVTVSPYAEEPIYLIDGSADITDIVDSATLEKPEMFNDTELEKRSLSKYKTLMTQLRLSLQDSLMLFRSKGPANVAVAMDLTEDNECSRYGGCRMLLCECYDKQWFKGYCEVCLRNIINKRKAIRIPNITGSWRGCFCSPGCVVYKIENTGEPLELLTFSRVWEEIKENGIFKHD